VLAHSQEILHCCTSSGAKEYPVERDGAGVLIPLLFHISKAHFIARLSDITQTGLKNKSGRKDIFRLKIRLPKRQTPAATLIPAITTTGNSLTVFFPQK